ncbi:hypothetical protein B0T10DRAFT_200385 [Thelonectria olida]|uniref:ML-like domain-containing protein n=1 Tax=Thelonectria olida TaxID=1576542 RepID=A0A9P8VW39_9HYPO|nr:hypothetical protein B0T10DRAFT_200385 [Thelonectria olida]
MISKSRPFGLLRSLLSAVIILPTVVARETVYINGTGADGVTRELDVSRYPDLYTRDFADCMNGESLFNVTRFDTAYYRDNLTVLFHMDGSTNIRQESLMLHLQVDVYGENRFNTTYEPCSGGISTMCPVKAGVAINAFAVLNLTSEDAQGFPDIALGIPDLEGFARLRIFANSTETEIGCFQAVLTNGQTFSQPEIIGSILGGFVILAVLASFATAVYGMQIPHMRMHYAHSFSLLVIFETFQSIFFLGALSVDWPSLLPAWWSNFAWTAGMFASDSMLNSLASFTGISGNASQVGGAGSVPINNGGGLSQQIYGQSLFSANKRSASKLATGLNSFSRRDDYNASNPYDYDWAGNPRNPGMPLPGDFTGFAGTLSMVNVPDRDAFIIGFIWLLVALGGVILFVTLVKLILDALVKLKLLKSDGFDYFRSHWLGFMASGLLRTLFIAFFAMMTLSTFQFALGGPAGPTAIAAIVFIIFLGLACLATYACCVRLREGKYEVGHDSLRLEQGRLFKTIPFVAATRESTIGEEEQADKPRLFGTIPFFRIRFIDNDAARPTTNQDVAYIERFGWLSGRYRRARWWFFAAYLGYQFGRACFIGAASQSPLAQVYGLFVFEVFTLVIIMKLSPFEGSRNTAMATWLLSISKIVTTGLSIAFLPSFNLNRIAATSIGLVILVVQGFLALAVLVLVVLGMFSTWMSLSRNHEKFPAPLDGLRIQYFERMEARTGDMPERPRTPEPEGTFNVKDVRRHPKINDLDEFPRLPGSDDPNMHIMHPLKPRSRAGSASSRYSVSSLRTGRTHRASWSSKDLADWDAEMNRGDQARMTRMRQRSGSLRRQSANVQGGFQPMTPTRESVEFPSPNPTSNPGYFSSQDKIQESESTPQRRRTVSFADPEHSPSGSNTSDSSTKVEEPPAGETVVTTGEGGSNQEEVHTNLVDETIPEKDEDAHS